MNFLKCILLVISPFKKNFLIIILLSCFVSVLDFVFLFSLVQILSSSIENGLEQFGNYEFPFVALSVISYILRSVLHPLIFFSTNALSTNAAAKLRSTSIQNLIFLKAWQIDELELGKFLDHYTRKYWILPNALLPAVVRLCSDLIFLVILITYFLIESRIILGTLFIVSFVTVIVVKIIHRRLTMTGKKLDQSSKELVGTFSVMHTNFPGIVTSGNPDFITARLNIEQKEILALMRRAMNISALPKFFIETVLYIIILILILNSEFLVNIGYFSEISMLALSAIRLIPIAVNVSNLFGVINLYSNLLSSLLQFEEKLLSTSERNREPQVVLPKLAQSHSDQCLNIEDFTINFLPDFNQNELVNLNLKKGNFLHITGESGSGKSTFLKCISGLDDRYNGSITISTDQPKQKIADVVEYVTQNAYLLNTSLYENLTLRPFRRACEDDNRVIYTRCLKILQALNLQHIVHYLNSEIDVNLISLSGGEKQRVHLARALITPKPIILFDEVTSSVDSINENIMLDAIEEFTEDALIIFVTHNRLTRRKSHISIQF